MIGEIYGFTAGIINLPVGITSFPVSAGLMSVVLKYSTGGSLEFGGATFAAGTGYLFDAGEVLSFDNRATYWLRAVGATATFYFIRGVSSGTAGASS